MNYIPVSVGNQTDKNAGPQNTNGNAGTQDNVNSRKEVFDQHYIVLPLWSSISSTFKSSDEKATDDKPTDDTGSKTVEEPVNKEDQAYRDELDRLTSQERRLVMQRMPLDMIQSVGAKADFNNMESSTIVSPIPTYRVYLDHPKDQILRDSKSAVQTRGMAKKSFEAHALVIYIHKQRKTNHKDYANCLFACFLSQMEPKKVYVGDIIFGSIKKSLCDEFEALMHKIFQMSSMEELTFFLGLQVKQSEEGIFISQD
nr:retrotransposon protein, putative, unclassified [Tanacetum cinerariifolium]